MARWLPVLAAQYEVYSLDPRTHITRWVFGVEAETEESIGFVGSKPS